MDSLTRSADNIIELLGKLIGGDLITKVTTGIENLTEAVNRATNPHGLSSQQSKMTTWQQFMELDMPGTVNDRGGRFDHLPNSEREAAREAEGAQLARRHGGGQQRHPKFQP